MMENRVVPTRRGAQGSTGGASKKSLDEQKPALEILKQAILDIESAYTDFGLPL